MKEKKLTGYPSIDKPWLKYYKEGANKTTTAPESMFQMMERCNKNRLNTIALDLRTSKDGFKKGIVITYKEYKTESIKRRAQFQTLFIQKMMKLYQLLCQTFQKAVF